MVLPVNKINMSISRKIRRWLFNLSLVLCCSYAAPLSAQQGSISIKNVDQLCAGFTQNSTAKIELVTETPFRLPETAGLTFDWYAQHENAQKRWNTPLPYRSVPLPWEGEYNIWVVVKYINKKTLAPFNSFKTKVVTINVDACPEVNTAKEGSKK